jgi:alpha-beta hydrolase superfamily lysophospholipase
MTRTDFIFTNKDHIRINVYKWTPEKEIKGVIQIAHGMSERAIRYEYFAHALVKEGYAVYANDHRGHGSSAASIQELGYISDNDGFQDMVDDMKQLTDIIHNENPEKKIILFGHSMGSFLAQRYIQQYAADISAVILSGTNGKQTPAVNVGILLTKILMRLKGRRAEGSLLDRMTFGSYNNSFQPAATSYDWLSRDKEQVQMYIDDPYCGNVFPVSFYHDLFVGTKVIHKRENLNRIPTDLPIYIFAGGSDPVGQNGKGIINLINIYKSLKIENVTYKLYPEGRHEMLHEINKDEVISDTIDWLDTVCP